MGNFEKLGILVIIVLVVTILVLTFWGMRIPLADEPPPVTELSGVRPGANSPPPELPRKEANDPIPVDEPGTWPPTPVRPKVEPPVVDLVIPTPVDPVDADFQHEVKKGETLWSIAVQYYGNGKFSKKIQVANPGVTAENLAVGRVLTIPNPDRLLAGGPAPDRPVPSGLRTYQVKKGDSLSAIARRELGTENRWREIHRLNEDVIGPDAARVMPGMTLVLPQ